MKCFLKVLYMYSAMTIIKLIIIMHQFYYNNKT